ncbi:MAG: inositol polyphosphate kinase family protein, partial [SAR324 cluster bacterium]|nr:inositol polyphosphate kinase family protein [SAR324 cluster bacterium]
MLLRLLPSDTTTRRQLIEACLERLIPLQNFFHHQRSFAFYSSSILVIYEGDPDGVLLSPDIPTPPPPVVDDADVSSFIDDGLTYRQKISTTPNQLLSSSSAHPLPRDLIDSNRHTQSTTTRDAKKEDDDVNVKESQILVSKDSSTDLEGVGSFSRHIDRCREHSPWFSSSAL